MLRLLCLFLLMASAAVAQQQASAKNLPEPNFKVDRNVPVAPQVRVVSSDGAQLPKDFDLRSGTCYTMRTYYFEQHGGSAPQPRGMTTCTPANRRTLRNTRRPYQGGAKLVPLAATQKSAPTKSGGN